jgi:flagellar basal-body rod modification protein FlgD
MTGTPGVGSPASGQPYSARPVSAATVDYGAFLQLLVAQLKNQDPSKPMDSTQYMAQLASFSNVEQTMIMNSKLDELLNSSAIEQANQLIGHTLTSADGKTSGRVVSVKITNEGLIATLADGKEMMVGPGVVIS